jgi:hypothetical protein
MAELWFFRLFSFLPLVVFLLKITGGKNKFSVKIASLVFFHLSNELLEVHLRHRCLQVDLLFVKVGLRIPARNRSLRCLG